VYPGSYLHAARTALTCFKTAADRKFKRGFGAMVREVIFCTGARLVTAEGILHQTVANLLEVLVGNLEV